MTTEAKKKSKSAIEGEGIVRSGASTYKVYLPNSTVTAEPDMNARYKGHTLREVESLAWSILQKGQLSPVPVRKDGSFIRVIAGFGRYAAVSLLNEKPEMFNLPAGTRTPLIVFYSAMNPEEALEANLEENLKRKGLSPMDQAIGIQMLERRGKTAAAIATIFERSEPWVYQMKRLLNLPSIMQDLIHDGTIGTALALKLATCEAREVLKMWEDADGDVQKLAKMVAGARKKAGKSVSHSMPEMRKLLEITDCYAAGVVMMWIKGEMDDEDFREELQSWKKSRSSK